MLVLALAVSAPTAVLAQPTASPSTPATGSTEGANNLEQARVHYERGVQLYNEANYDVAQFEFERAYELAPSYKILYNLAHLQRQQNNYAAALQTFQRYLRDGDANIPADRRQEVTAEIETLKSRVASIAIQVSEPGADISIDDAPICSGTRSTCVGKSPLPAPVLVNPGRRKISATKAGFATTSSTVTVVGSDATSVTLTLQPLAKAERVVDPAPRNRAIVAWVATGALAAGAITTGVIAVSNAGTLSDNRKTANIDPATLARESRNVKTFSLVSDILTGTAIVSGLVATYLTVKASRSERDDAPPPPKNEARIGFDAGLGGASIHGVF